MLSNNFQVKKLIEYNRNLYKKQIKEVINSLGAKTPSIISIFVEELQEMQVLVL